MLGFSVQGSGMFGDVRGCRMKTQELRVILWVLYKDYMAL